MWVGNTSVADAPPHVCVCVLGGWSGADLVVKHGHVCAKFLGMRGQSCGVGFRRELQGKLVAPVCVCAILVQQVRPGN